MTASLHRSFLPRPHTIAEDGHRDVGLHAYRDEGSVRASSRETR
jgi:hypothetical protein